MMTPDKVIEMNVKYVKERMAEKGDICPLFILHTKKSVIPVFAPFRDDNEKSMILTLLKVLMIKHKAYAYSVCIEAWVAKRKLNDPPLKGQVKDQPDRIEVCLVGYVGYDKQVLKVLPVIRGGDKVSLAEPEADELDKVSGRFYELLPPKEVHDKPFTQTQEVGLDLMLKMADKMFGLKVEEIALED